MAKKKPQRKSQPGDVLQVRYSPDQVWMDYSTIREGECQAADGLVARGIHTIDLEGKKAEFRVIRYYRGQAVISGPRM